LSGEGLQAARTARLANAAGVRRRIIKSLSQSAGKGEGRGRSVL
jgi:hypothetical protein